MRRIGGTDGARAGAGAAAAGGSALRAIAAALAVAVVLPAAGLLPAGTAAAQEAPEARGIDRVCPAPDEVAGEIPVFPDLDATHGAALECAAAYGVVEGFADGTARPGVEVTRGQVASMVSRWLRTATGFTLPVPDEPAFSDLGGSVHADAVSALAAAGIVGGREDGTFGPGEPLTRGQLAAVVTAAISYADIFEVGGPLPPPDSTVTFTDVDGTTFEDAIGSLAGVGIVQGDTTGAYRPDLTVTRGQLATFLMRAADYLDRYARWAPTAGVEVLVVALRGGEVVVDDGEGGLVPGGQPDATATAVLSFDAFNGTLAYSLHLSGVDGPFTGGGGAVIHLGVAGSVGPVALQLIDGAGLDAADGDVATGVVFESASAVRFADLLASPDEAYLVIGSAAHPEGAVRGQLG